MYLTPYFYCNISIISNIKWLTHIMYVISIVCLMTFFGEFSLNGIQLYKIHSLDKKWHPPHYLKKISVNKDKWVAISSIHLVEYWQIESSYNIVYKLSKDVLPVMFKSSTRLLTCYQSCLSLQHAKRRIASHVQVFNTSKDVLPAMFKSSTHQKTYCQPCSSLQHVKRRVPSHVQVFNTLKDM
jgi:hypothetical protein